MLKPGTPSADARQLLMALMITGDDDIVAFEDGTQIDWSVKLRDENGFEIGRSFDVFDGTNTAVMDMQWDRIERLSRALIILLLNRSVADDRASAETAALNEHYDRKQIALAAATAVCAYRSAWEVQGARLHLIEQRPPGILGKVDHWLLASGMFGVA